jgi:uncharacterized RDD family membrane protein YckC
MPITFTCQCGKEFVAKDEHAGMVARCTACGKDLVIPSQSGVQAAPAPEQTPPVQMVPSGAPRQLFCPRCRALNSEQAIFCYSCGANLAGAPPGPVYQPYGPPLYAGFWRRFVASFIDSIILSVVGCVIGAIVGLLFTLPQVATSGKVADEYAVIAQAVAYLLGTVLGWLYFALMESSSMQATLGKMAIGLYVTDLNGQRISFGRATGRHFGKIVSGLILMIGYIMAGFTEKKQALHDIMASCLVTRKS